MRKSFIVLMAIALFIPAFSMAAPLGSNWNHGNGNNNGHNNGGSYNPGNNYGGHNNGGSYNPGNNNGGHNHGGSYNPGNNNGGHNNGGYNPGNNHGGNHHGGNSNHNNAALLMEHREVKRAFAEADNAYSPFIMSQQDIRRMAMTMRKLTDELGRILNLVDRKDREEIREVGIIVERAKFYLLSENSPREAHMKLQRAEMKYDRVAIDFY